MIIKNRIKQLSQNKILIMHSLCKILWTYCIFMIWVNKSKHFWPCLMVIDMYVLVEFAATSYGKTHRNILYVWGIYWDGCGCVVPKVGYISKWFFLAFFMLFLCHLWMWFCWGYLAFLYVWVIYGNGYVILSGGYIPKGVIHWIIFCVWIIGGCGHIIPRFF